MSILAPFLRRFSYVRRLEKRLRKLESNHDALQAEANTMRQLLAPGALFSPIPSATEVAEAYARGGFGPPFAGVDLNEARQVELLESFAAFYPEQPFPQRPKEGWRYHLDNPSYGAFDGIMLYCMLRHLQPRRIIEVGSGYSSAAMLDLNQHVFGERIEQTFIDPDMTRLNALLRPEDSSHVRQIERRVQDVPLATFDALDANDVLFVDSSHVAKIGSDVNHLIFEVLPRLRPGVHVHIHDIAGNFEYPREWFAEGRAWNEQYLVRAFLMHNRAYEIVLYTQWLPRVRLAFLREKMPLCALDAGGQLWIRRVA